MRHIKVRTTKTDTKLDELLKIDFFFLKKEKYDRMKE